MLGVLPSQLVCKLFQEVAQSFTVPIFVRFFGTVFGYARGLFSMLFGETILREGFGY